MLSAQPTPCSSWASSILFTFLLKNFCLERPFPLLYHLSFDPQLIHTFAREAFLISAGEKCSYGPFFVDLGYGTYCALLHVVPVWSFKLQRPWGQSVLHLWILIPSNRVLMYRRHLTIFTIQSGKKKTAWSSVFLKIFTTCAKTRISKFHAPLLQWGGAKCFLKNLIAINTAQEVRWLHDSQPFSGLILQLCCQSQTMTFNESPAVYITVYIFGIIPQVSPLNDL